jgi:predicted Fe-Mo cluster-binding NifX family protein
MDDPMDPRFGRCAWFMFTSLEGGDATPVANGGRDSANGAGIQAAQLLVDRKVDMLITGAIGPNALRVLAAAGTRVFTCNASSCTDALSQLRAGGLQETVRPTAQGHHGHGWEDGSGVQRGRAP